MAKIMAKKVGKEYTFIDLFAGIGGFHLAFHEHGAKCVFASEWDEKARQTYTHNFKRKSPELFRADNFAGDITKVETAAIPDFDILTGGFPCQPFSQAGFKKGFEDTRGTLFFDIARIIKDKKPKAFFIENVRHLYKHDEGRTFEAIKNVIEKDLGYSFHYKIVKASDYGLPQHRPRIFIVGFRDPETPFSFPEPRPLRFTMSDVFGGDCNRDIGFTLRLGGRGSGIHDRRNWDTYLVDGEVVRLTSTEGKKMMGFPESFHFPVSEAAAMRQLGNSVAVDAVSAVAQEIFASLNTKYYEGK